MDEFAAKRTRRNSEPDISPDEILAASDSRQFRECLERIRAISTRITVEEETNDAGQNTTWRITPELGTRVGKYELQEEIGRGGAGRVFKAWDSQANRSVALKLLNAGQLASDDEIARLKTEASTSARLSDAGFVEVYEAGIAEQWAFIAMELVDGPTLKDWAEQRTIEPQEAAHIVSTLARSLGHAHKKNIVHRDIKPSNVLIAGTPPDRRFLIADLGLAKPLDADESLTRSGAILGTPHFMPPEQANGEAVTPGADVYSLGAVLYMLLTGRALFARAGSTAVLQSVLNDMPKMPRTCNPAVPRDLETICLKCLAKAPENRYASGEEMAEELDRFLGNTPIQARRSRVIRSLRPKNGGPSMRRVVLLLSVVLVAVLFMQWANHRTVMSTSPGQPAIHSQATIPRLNSMSVTMLETQSGRVFNVFDLAMTTSIGGTGRLPSPEDQCRINASFSSPVHVIGGILNWNGTGTFYHSSNSPSGPSAKAADFRIPNSRVDGAYQDWRFDEGPGLRLLLMGFSSEPIDSEIANEIENAVRKTACDLTEPWVFDGVDWSVTAFDRAEGPQPPLPPLLMEVRRIFETHPTIEGRVLCLPVVESPLPDP